MIVFTGLLTSFEEPINSHKRLRIQGINLTARDANLALRTQGILGLIEQASKIVRIAFSELCEILCGLCS